MPPDNMPQGKAILGTGPKQAPGSIVARLIRLLACPTRTMATKRLGLAYNRPISFIILCFAISASVITMAGCAGFSSNPGSPPLALAITISALPSGTAQSAYSATLAAAGGTKPYAWSITSGSLPTGVTLTASSGLIAGTPTQSGTFAITVQVKDSSSPAQTTSQGFSIVIAAAGAPVSITTSSLPSGTQNVGYSTTLAATGGKTPYTWSITSGSLPTGVTLTASSGLISGTPTQSGTFPITVQVKDSSSPAQTASQGFSIVIAAAGAPVSITTSSLPSGTQNVGYSTTLAAIGGKTPYTWSITSGSLPTGVTLTASSGLIAGTPTQSGTFPITVQVNDSSSPAQTASQGFSIVIAAVGAPVSITTSSLPSGTQNSTYSATLGAAGGKTPYTWSITSGSLPTGVTLTASSGLISGTPTQAGQFSFTAQVGDSSSPRETATQALNLVVASPISVSVLPTSANVQVGQSQQFTAAVSGTTNAAVNWLVSGIQGGNSTVGTISSTGLYTAPSIAPTNPVTVTAQSTSNLSASANATITITSPIPENQEKAFIYVDPNTGNNSNPGTQAQPLKTVQAAASIAFDNNKNNVGTRVTLNPGTYRENVYYNTPSTSAPVTFQAAQNGTAIITGSDLWTGWTSAGNIFTHNWPYTWGECALPNGWPSMWPIILRREMIFVNGTPLTQVISANQMVEGTFYVDDASQLVSMWPPSGTNMSTAAIEVAVRPGTFNIQSATNVVLRGITFEHANTCPQAGNSVTVTSSNHILIDTDKFLWNNQAGLGSNLVNNVVVQNSVANHNGSLGIGASQGKDHNYYNNETSYNNWREAMGAFYGWSYDGAKILLMHTADFNGFKAYYNQTGGIWFDTDNKNITLENLDSSNNLTYGMFLEADEGPITITDSKFCNNNDNESPKSSFGALISGNAEYVTVSGSLFYNNAVPDFGGEIFIGGTSAGRTFKDWETGQTYTVQSQNWTLNGNTVVGVGSSEHLFYSYQTGAPWSLFTSTFASNHNTWWNASNANVFNTSAGVFNFAGWAAAMGQDVNSTFSDPAAACAAPVPDYPDYWLTTYFGGDTQTVTPGASASYTIQIFPVGAFTGTVNLSVDGVTQIGATSSLGAQSILTSGSTTLTVNTSGSTSVGTFPITVIASSGSVVRTLTLTLTVQ